MFLHFRLLFITFFWDSNSSRILLYTDFAFAFEVAWSTDSTRPVLYRVVRMVVEKVLSEVSFMFRRLEVATVAAIGNRNIPT